MRPPLPYLFSGGSFRMLGPGAEPGAAIPRSTRLKLKASAGGRPHELFFLARLLTPLISDLEHHTVCEEVLIMNFPRLDSNKNPSPVFENTPAKAPRSTVATDLRVT